MIAVAQDAEGLRIAYVELLEEAMDAPERERNERFAEMAANPEALLGSVASRRTLSPGYYGWIGYLQEAIEGPLECGVLIAERDLSAEEIEGLAALRAGKMDFRQKHPPCAGCGRPLADAMGKKCGDCQRAEFEAGARGGR
jgi:hypothetical protein